jgi:hypothetical protein
VEAAEAVWAAAVWAAEWVVVVVVVVAVEAKYPRQIA